MAQPIWTFIYLLVERTKSAFTCFPSVIHCWATKYMRQISKPLCAFHGSCYMRTPSLLRIRQQENV